MNAQKQIFLIVIAVSYVVVVAGSGQCDGSLIGRNSVEANSESDRDSSEARESSNEDCNYELYEIVEPINFNDQIAEDAAACQNSSMLQCDPESPYRTINGSCNNLKHPTWGMTTDCFLRFQPAFYTGHHGIRESRRGGPLTEPRQITLNIFKTDERPSLNLTFMFTIYGQMVAHDLSRIQNLPVPGNDCCLPANADHPNCIHIPIGPNDPFYSQFNVTCIDLKRSAFCTECNTTHREQKSIVTGILDSSTVYGFSDEKAASTRTYDGTGKLKSNQTGNGEMLITGKDPTDPFCFPEIESQCFVAGDARVNHHASLSSLHTIFMREHNRIATKLKELNPMWGEERLYQESRKINSAELQCITYKEYLPALLGPSLMRQFNLSVKTGPGGSKYNPDIRLGVVNEFGASMFRLHNMITSKTGIPNVNFRDLYSKPQIIREGHLEELVQGICKQPSDRFGRLYSADVTDYLNKRPFNPYGKDLAAIDVQRSRDHGLAPYIYFVNFCSGGKVNITSFDDLSPRLMSAKLVDILKNTFAAVEDVDIWAGIQMEHHLPDSELGPTIACVIAKQFYNSKFADRFYFEHEDQAPSFTEDQRQSLKKCSLSRLLCDNSNVNKVQKNSMLLPSQENPKLSCDEIPSVDLTPWKENSTVTT